MRRYLRAARDRLWLVPLLGLAAGIGLSFALIAVDRASAYKLIPPDVAGTANAAQQILAVSITALISLTSIVLTLTLVAVQLAMAQFSPRIVGTLLRDRRSQLAIALFLATLAHSMLTLRQVNVRSGQVPGLAVVFAYGMALACVAGLVLYVNHSSRSLRVGPLIDIVGDDTRDEIERVYARSSNDRLPPRSDEVIAGASGNVVHVFVDDLVALAHREGCVVELVPGMGDYVPRGSVLFRVRGQPAHDVEPDIRYLVKLSSERTHERDPAYGIRKLVDIAERSVYSSPFQDPTTAVQAIHRIHECLRLLVTRRLPDGRHYDDDGQLRLITPELNWDGYVRLAFDEIRIAGAGSPQIARRVRAALIDLLAVAPPQRRHPLQRQLELLDRAVRRQLHDEEDVRTALVPDAEGIGSGVDVTVRTDGSAGAVAPETVATGKGRNATS